MSFLKIVGAVLILALVDQIQAQNGAPCHASFFQFTPRHSLNMSAYMGDWYMHEIASSDIGNFPEPDFKCAKRHLSLPDLNDTLNLDATDMFVNLADNVTIAENKRVSVNATRSPLSSMWKMYSGEEGEEIETQVIILSTDLDFAQWSVVYSCSHRGPEDYRYEVVMAMTRSRTITADMRSFLKALMVGQGFRIGDHWPVDQTNCA